MTVEKLKAELNGKNEAGARLRAGVSPADREPHPDALHRHSRAGRREDLRRQPRKIQRKAFEVEKLINGIPGAAGVSPSRVQGKPYLNIKVDRHAMARYGLSAKDVLDAVEVAIGGKNVSTTIEGRQRFPIQVRVRAQRAG